MHVNLASQLLLIVLSCGGTGVIITAMLLPHWITYYHHSKFWERTQVLTMGIFDEGRLGVSLREKHGNREVDFKFITDGRWTRSNMKFIRTAAITAAVSGSLATFLSIWYGLRFGSDKSIPCACMSLRCISLIVSAGAMSLTTGLFVYIMWPLLQHKKRMRDSGIEPDEELNLGICIYLSAGAICTIFLAFMFDLLIICCNRHRRRHYRPERMVIKVNKKSVSRKAQQLQLESSRKLTKCQSKNSISTTLSSQSLKSNSKASNGNKPPRVIHVGSVKPAPIMKRSITAEPQPYYYERHQRQAAPEYQEVTGNQTDRPRRKAPQLPPVVGTSHSKNHRQRAQSESARDLRRLALSPDLERHTRSLKPQRRAPPPLPPYSSGEHVNCKRSRSKDTLISYSNSSLISSRGSHNTLI